MIIMNKELYKTIESNSTQLKKQLDMQYPQLHRLLQKCLNLSTRPSACNLTGSTRLLLQQHLKSLIHLQAEISASTKVISNKLIQSQINFVHEQELFSLLSQYSQVVGETRNRLIEKECDLYYLLKTLYQSYEDTYENCVVTPKRLAAVETFWSKKKLIIDDQKLLAKLTKEVREAGQQGTDDNQAVERDFGEIQEQNENEEIEEWQYERHYNINPKLKKAPLNQRYYENNMQTVYKNDKQFYPGLQEQTTTGQLKQILTKSIRKKKQVLGSLHKLPLKQFAQFQTFFYKIEMQEERKEKLETQYMNFMDVYKVINQENQTLLAKYKLLQQRNLEQQSNQHEQTAYLQNNGAFEEAELLQPIEMERRGGNAFCRQFIEVQGELMQQNCSTGDQNYAMQAN